jgi:hypothetical protein
MEAVLATGPVHVSYRGPKGEPNASITTESEMMDLLRLLKMFWQPDLFMLAIGVDPEYRYVSR